MNKDMNGIEEKITCPFIKSAHKAGLLGYESTASIANVRALGNEGGGTLGSVLAFFAWLNHTPEDGPRETSGLVNTSPRFPLDFIHSNGQHFGSSRILHQGIVDYDAWNRFEQSSRSVSIAGLREQCITFPDLCKFIADNLRRDKATKIPGVVVTLTLFWTIVTSRFKNPGDDRFRANIHRFFTDYPIVVCAGEWALMYALLENAPWLYLGKGAKITKDALSFEILRALFIHKCLLGRIHKARKSKWTWMKMATKLFFGVRRELKQ